MNTHIANARRVLVIPDAWYGNASGAIVAQELVRHLKAIDCKVAVYCHDIQSSSSNRVIDQYGALPYNGWMNIRSSKYRRHFSGVIDQFNPTHLFFIGSITNKPLCYLEEGLHRQLHINVFIFMQDFFCYKFYANDMNGPCRKCIDFGLTQCLKQKCGHNHAFDYAKQIVGIATRHRLQKLLQQVNWVITSSDEQVKSYEDFGISTERIMKIPLFFDRNRLKKQEVEMGNYYIGIAQNRVEKGFHLIPQILKYVDPSVKIILAYNGKESSQNAISRYHFQEFIDKGVLEIKDNLTWSNGLGEAIARSRGVIIPSIWPTTTEYGLLEALGLGKPVFTFSVGIHPEIIEQGVNGYTFRLDNYAEFGETLSMMSSSDYIRVSEGAKTLYNKLTDEKIWQQLLATSM